MSKRFVKRPIAVEAFRFGYDDMPDWFTPTMIRMNYENAIPYLEGCISTLEGDMWFSEGDYVIRGVNGEQYPCKGDIFDKTYEEENARQLTGERDILSLEECMKKYPLGTKSIFTNLEEVYRLNAIGYPRSDWKKDLQLDGGLLYELRKEEGGFTYNFLVRKRNEDKYYLVEVLGDNMIFYYTYDGFSYSPFWDDEDEYKNRENKKFQKTIKPDFSNLYEVIRQIVKEFDEEHGTQTTVFPTYEDFIKSED